MSISKAWDWNRGKSDIWLTPSEEGYYLADLWKRRGHTALLDFGCGLGRHAVFFAKEGFEVSAFDLSPEGVEHLRAWASREGVTVDARVADMLRLPYADAAFDCLFAYHVISHTDTPGAEAILREARRVLKPGGEFFLTLCSKASWSFAGAGYPKIDENTVRKTADGPEKDVPHFYVDLDDAARLLTASGLKPTRVRHIEECILNGEKDGGTHYFILGEA